MKNEKSSVGIVLMALVLLLAPSVALANSALASAKDCFSCHSIDEKVIGPAYQAVAARYAGKSDAELMLIKKVMKGGSGTWGSTRMPANNQVNENEARILVEWVLSQTK